MEDPEGEEDDAVDFRRSSGFLGCLSVLCSDIWADASCPTEPQPVAWIKPLPPPQSPVRLHWFVLGRLGPLSKHPESCWQQWLSGDTGWCPTSCGDPMGCPIPPRAPRPPAAPPQHLSLMASRGSLGKNEVWVKPPAGKAPRRGAVLGRAPQMGYKPPARGGCSTPAATAPRRLQHRPR